MKRMPDTGHPGQDAAPAEVIGPGLFVKIQRIIPLLILAATGSAFAADNYYGALRINSARYEAHDMSSSARPGLGQFVTGDETNTATGASLALGYQLPANWRVEAEYTLPKNNEFTSGSTRFPTSFNHHKIRSQRLMVNAYKDFPLNNQFSLRHSRPGPGTPAVQRLARQPWPPVLQRIPEQSGLLRGLWRHLYARPKVSIDLGWRYVDMGKTKSGANNFTNVRGLADEQMRAKLTSSEVSIGLRYSF